MTISIHSLEDTIIIFLLHLIKASVLVNEHEDQLKPEISLLDGEKEKIEQSAIF